MRNKSIEELRKICQPEYPQVKTNPYYRIYRRFFRLFSIYITRFLINLNVSANFISVLAIIFGVLGALFFYFKSFLFGGVLLQFWFLMDTIDGELARYYSKNKKEDYLIKGEYLDLNSHHLIHSLIFIGLYLGSFRLTNDLELIYLGFAALFALSLNELIDLNKIKVLFLHNIKKKSEVNYRKNLLKKITVIYTFPSVINLLLIFSMFNQQLILAYFYGITFPLLVLIKFCINNFARK